MTMLGDALLSEGAITAAQLERALADQRTSGALLGETLLDLKFVTDEALSRALAREAGVPFASVAGARPDPIAVTLVPEPFARKRLLAPLEIKGAVLRIVQANPFDVLAVDDLRRLTSHAIESRCATPGDVRALLDRCYVRPPDSSADDRSSMGEAVSVPSAIDEREEPETTVRALSELGLTRRDLAIVGGLLNHSPGLLLVSGPAGSGITTTLYAMLAQLADGAKHIVTIEARVERRIPAVRQTEIAPETGFTYATATRSLLRQDPAVIMIDDLREPEVAQLALLAASSGPLVLTRLATDDVAGALARFDEMGLERYRLASALVGIVGQRLIRRICPECSERVTYPPEILEKVGLAPDPVLAFHRGRGCVLCGGTGYRGLTGVFEIMRVDAAIQSLVREGADARTIRQVAISAGMKTITDDALAKAIFQQTTLEEVLRVAEP